jgi:hypothetical protein
MSLALIVLVCDVKKKQIFYQETEYLRNGPIVELGITYSFNIYGKTKKEKEFEWNKHFK